MKFFLTILLMLCATQVLAAPVFYVQEPRFTRYSSAHSVAPASLPTQTGNGGKYLSTDGTAASWSTVAATDATKLPLSGGALSGVMSIGTNSNTTQDLLSIRNSSNGSLAQTRIHFDDDVAPSTTAGGSIFYTGSAFAGFPGNSFGFWNHANGIMAIATNNLERMRITADGKVGVGNTAPGYPLDVTGTVRATSFIMNPALPGSVLLGDSATVGTTE